MRKFGIVVGRWDGAWSWLWYADVMHESDQVPYMSFNALSKRGAMRKAQRYIRRLTSPIEDKQADVYVYDESEFKLQKISI
jgi:hypothetical protein